MLCAARPLTRVKGIIIDAVRAVKTAKDRGSGGPAYLASAYLMNSPPVQMADDKARTELEAFVTGADEALSLDAKVAHTDSADSGVSHFCCANYFLIQASSSKMMLSRLGMSP